MIDGFETRENTDIPVRALVKSAKGTLYKRPGASVDQYITTMIMIEVIKILLQYLVC